MQNYYRNEGQWWCEYIKGGISKDRNWYQKFSVKYFSKELIVEGNYFSIHNVNRSNGLAGSRQGDQYQEI